MRNFRLGLWMCRPELKSLDVPIVLHFPMEEYEVKKSCTLIFSICTG